jgi:ABC-type tungstate transport system permease subunit
VQNMHLRALVFALSAFVAPITTCGLAEAQEKSIVVASTTSTQDSGLFGHILPAHGALRRVRCKGFQEFQELRPFAVW